MLDGVYVESERATLRFQEVAPPTDDEMESLIETIIESYKAAFAGSIVSASIRVNRSTVRRFLVAPRNSIRSLCSSRRDDVHRGG